MSDDKSLTRHNSSKRARVKRLAEPLAAPQVESNVVRSLDSDAHANEQPDASGVHRKSVESKPVESRRREFLSEETAMNDHAHDDKRDAGSPEDQSKHAANEAKLAVRQAQKAADAAAIAAQELAKRKAISAHAAAILKAEQERDQSRAERERSAQQLDSASKVSRHLQNVLNDAMAKKVEAQNHYNKLMITIDQAKAELDAATNEVNIRNAEFSTAQKNESDLRATVTQLDTADETFEKAKADAEVELARAKSDYAAEIAKIKKDAADRDMQSFGT